MAVPSRAVRCSCRGTAPARCPDPTSRRRKAAPRGTSEPQVRPNSRSTCSTFSLCLPPQASSHCQSNRTRWTKPQDSPRGNLRSSWHRGSGVRPDPHQSRSYGKVRSPVGPGIRSELPAIRSCPAACRTCQPAEKPAPTFSPVRGSETAASARAQPREPNGL